ncbi:HypC/HybG/HupF family hydrogenase formation chaperone [Saccharopolyspora rhizosphaerae]|uniref:HypC/HybG/HupF family hydrogenase formation chaperone n=1 Tax=Saccharopolyspora rhizosphaerae TaxID=2492662 RepID=A0A426JZY0_9PSEU|nr:HypC/HybG/HupF family hydrogenase formation chaperone [Saccharopolyspora rhizosphaerae]RRO18656.1 HypC/HybG/HupF family hydrogenase formation chaperone [Saccharopolyspora rhizosphaerae]
MCLGIPGEVVELVADNDQLAIVDVVGARRRVNIGLLEPGSLAPGDWVLIHVGFAVEKVDRAQADEALSGLELMGQAMPEEERPTR